MHPVGVTEFLLPNYYVLRETAYTFAVELEISFDVTFFSSRERGVFALAKLDRWTNAFKAPLYSKAYFSITLLLIGR